MLNKIHNMDCMELMECLNKGSVDVILTSPFYNTNKKAGKSNTLTNTNIKRGEYSHIRYDVHVDNMSDEEYCDFTVKLFNGFDKVLKPNGVILYNLSYGADGVDGMIGALQSIISRTNFSVADSIIWKKKTALPNNMSPNRLTRIAEYIFVICRKNEIKTFKSNKQVVSLRKTGQKSYENIYNFVEARNNDETCPLNKATYSTELCEKLLSIYAEKGDVVYDPFMGTGTTAVACVKNEMTYVGSELSKEQCKWAEDRIKALRPPKDL